MRRRARGAGEPPDAARCRRRSRRWACAPKTCALARRAASRRAGRRRRAPRRRGAGAPARRDDRAGRARRGASGAAHGRARAGGASTRRGCTASTPTAARIELRRAARAGDALAGDACATVAARWPRSSSSGTRTAPTSRRRSRPAWRAWNRAHADVQVEAVALPYDGFASKLEAAIPRGNGPDLVHRSGTSAIGEWARAGPHRASRRRRCRAGEFLDGTVEPLRAGRQAVRACRSPSRAWRCSIARISSPRRRRPPTSSSRWRGRTKATKPAGHYALAYEAGASFYHAPWLHGFGGRSSTRRPRPRSTPTAPSPRSRSSSRSPPSELLPPESTGVVATQLFNDGRAAHHHQRPVVRRRDRARRALRRGAAADGERDRPAGGAARRRSRRCCCRRAATTPRSGGGLRRAGSPAPRRRGSARASGARRWPRAPPGTIRRSRGDPILAAFRAQLAATVPMSNAPAMRAGLGAGASRRCARCCAARPSPRRRSPRRRRAILEALRPPPPPAPALPYVALLRAGRARRRVLVGRRARARGGARDDARAVGGLRLPGARGASPWSCWSSCRSPSVPACRSSGTTPATGPSSASATSPTSSPRATRRSPIRSASTSRSPSRCCGPSPTSRCTSLIGVTLALLLRDPLLEAARRLSRAAHRAVGGAELHHRAHLEGHVPPPVRRHQRRCSRWSALHPSPGSRASGPRSPPTSSPTSGSASRS